MQRHISRLALVSLACAGTLAMFLSPYLQRAALASNATSATFQSPQPQTAPFFITPYYGRHGITSFFDHQYPTYGQDGVVVVYTGESSSGYCTTYCYDGHDGIDFGLNYEPVLAAAEGW